MLSLLETFIDAGQDSAVVHGTRLETALVGVVATTPHLIGQSENAEKVAHDFTNHIMAGFKVLRTMVWEDGIVKWERWCRRFPKTGSIRKLLSTAQWIRVKQVLSKIKGPRSIMEGTQSQESLPSSSGSSPVHPVVVYDHTGLPSCFAPSRKEPPAPVPVVGEETKPLPALTSGVPTPNQKKRKLQTIHSRSSKQAFDQILDTKIEKVYMSITSEDNARCELVAAIRIGDKIKRTHLRTFLASRDGPKYKIKGENLKNQVLDQGLTKRQAIALPS